MNSWEGLEDYRRELREVCSRIRQYELQIDAYCQQHNINALNFTLKGLSGNTNNELAIRNAQDLFTLQRLNGELVSLGLDSEFIRQEWISILDPQ